MNKLPKNFISKCLNCVCIVAVMVLSGCATHFTSKVHIKHDWPSHVNDQTYVLESNVDYADTDEFKETTEQVKARLTELGFTEVSDKATPAFKIEIRLNTRLRSQLFSTYTPYFLDTTPFGYFIPHDPFYPYFIRSAFYPRHFLMTRHYSPMISVFNMGGRIDPFYLQRMMDRELFQHSLSIAINEAQTGKNKFTVSAQSDQFGYEIYAHLPFLTQSALKEFPGKNGKFFIEIPYK